LLRARGATWGVALLRVATRGLERFVDHLIGEMIYLAGFIDRLIGEPKIREEQLGRRRRDPRLATA
jgi:hypothetical protein